jgi:hypothetical protein
VASDLLDVWKAFAGFQGTKGSCVAVDSATAANGYLMMSPDREMARNAAVLAAAAMLHDFTNCSFACWTATASDEPGKSFKACSEADI